MTHITSQEMSETEMMLSGYGLTFAEFTYRMPDYKNVLNSFSWQLFDLAPDYPKLFKFIGWRRESPKVLTTSAIRPPSSATASDTAFRRSRRRSPTRTSRWET